MDRIVILGTTCSGKSTLATRLAQRLELSHIELDAFYHGPGWQPIPPEDFRRALEERVSSQGWVCDGNYMSRTAEWLWPRADTIVWLHIPLWRILPRLVKRSLRRLVTRQELWNGNRERWSGLVGKDSLPMWAIRSHPRHAAELPPLLETLENQGVNVVRLHSPREIDQWCDETTLASECQ